MPTPARKSSFDLDVTLIHTAQGGDIDAFQNIVRATQQQVLAIAKGIVGDFDAAQDVGQEIYLRLYRNLDSFKTGKSFSSWFYKIIVNAAYDHLKREKKFVSEQFDDDTLQQLAVQPNEMNDTAVSQLLTYLPTAQKACFILREFEERSCEEIADILGIRVGTVRSHLCLARRTLQKVIRWYYPEYLQ